MPVVVFLAPVHGEIWSFYVLVLEGRDHQSTDPTNTPKLLAIQGTH